MQLTQDQEAAVAAFNAFMASDDKEMVISGPAGVGKTTLLRHLMQTQQHLKLQKLLAVNQIDQWGLTATTNKAADVLAASMGEETATVHSLLGITVRPDYKTGQQLLSRKHNAKILSDHVLVIDECSMIDRKLDKLIDESTYRCKILYVGDHCQLAPVMEDLSPVFKRTKPIMLNQIVRSQHAPAITALSNQLRHQVETQTCAPLVGEPGVIDYLTPEQAMAEMRHVFVDHPDTLGRQSRILAYRNAQVIGFNNWIRGERGLPAELTVGEWAISNSATILHESGQRLRIEQEVQLLGIHDPETFTVEDGVTTQVRVVETSGGPVYVPVDRDHVEALIKYYAKKKQWFEMFLLKDHMADLRPRDACTVHKSQGSTYHTVFVDLKDIGRCTQLDQALRMLYVACSRATHRICFIGELPPRLRGG